MQLSQSARFQTDNRSSNRLGNWKISRINDGQVATSAWDFLTLILREMEDIRTVSSEATFWARNWGGARCGIEDVWVG